MDISSRAVLRSSRKYPYFPTEGIGISWGMGGSGRSKNIKKCMKLYWNFLRDGEVLEKNPFHGGGMDIFWNYTYQFHALFTFESLFTMPFPILVSVIRQGM